MKIKWLISFVVLLAIWSCDQPKHVDWYPYYESQHKQPFGTYVFKEELSEIFQYSIVETITSKTEEEYEEYYAKSNGTFMYVHPHFYPDSLTLELLLNSTQYKNGLFIATRNYSNVFFRKQGINLKEASNGKYNFSLEHFYETDENFEINCRENVYYFDSLPEHTQVLGTVEINGVKQPNYISMIIGDQDATILLHANPELYTNYHMLNEDDGYYAISSMKFLIHNDYLYWDGYGTARRYLTPPQEGGSMGMLRYITKNKSLLAGLLTLVSGLVIFLGFNYKRKVRSIPIHTRPKNHSLAFMRMVASLFTNEKNHIDLARYRVNYLLERIKVKYQLNISDLNDQFIADLAHKTSSSDSEINRMVWQLNKAKRVRFMDKEEFMIFNKTIEKYIYNLDIHNEYTRNE